MDAAAWDERYRSADYVWTAAPNRLVAEHLADLPPGRAVDLGAGEGRNAVWLASQGWEVTAVDFSAVGLDKARRLAAEHGVEIATVEADVHAFPLRAATWDLVLLAYLQLPVAEQETLVRRVAAALAPGGTLMVIAHDASNLDSGWGGPQDPAVLYSVPRTLAAAGGLTPVRAEVIRRPVDTPLGLRTALDTLVLARREQAPDGCQQS